MIILKEQWGGGKKVQQKEKEGFKKKMFWIWRRVQWRIENLGWNKMHFLSLSFSLSFSLSTAVVHVAMLY